MAGSNVTGWQGSTRDLPRNWRDGFGLPPARALAGVFVAALLAGTAVPGKTQTGPDQPYYANGEIHCPDGGSASFQSSGEPPTAAAMQLGCSFRGTSAAARAEAPTPVAAAPAADPVTSEGGLRGLMGAPSLTQRPDPSTVPGDLRCPDGTTRPFTGTAPGALAQSMICSEPAAVWAERHRQATTALARKKLEGQLRGDEGVQPALVATMKTGSPAYLLGSPWVWLIGIGIGLLLLFRLFGSKR